LTAAASAGGGRVYLPPATYVVTNLTIDSYVTLQGAGHGSILQSKAASTGYILALTTPASSQQVHIRDLTLKPNVGTCGGINLDNTGFGTSIDPLHVVENVVVLNAGGDAFRFDNSMRELKVIGCYAHYSGGYGFYVGAGTTDSRFIGNTVGPSTSHAYEIIGNNNNFIGCKAFYAGYNGSIWNTTSIGFHLNGTNYSTLTSCSAQQNALHGFSVESCSRVTMVGCESDTNSAGTTTGVGINTYWSTYCVISDNTGANNGILSPGAQKYGLQVDGTQTGTCFIGNTITGSSGDFGYVSGSGYMLISSAIADLSGIPTKINDVTQFALAGATSGTTTVTPAAIASGTWSLPATTDTFVGKATTDVMTNKTLTTPVVNGTITGTGQATAATVSTIMMRDSSGNSNIINMFEGFRTTATAAGTTTLTIADTQIQEFTGVTTQTVKLPTTSIPAGAQYIIVNSSTGAVTVQSSGANTINILAAGTTGVYTALVATPTTAANWSVQYMGAAVASGKKLSASNTLTLAGTDGTTMTFPSTSSTVMTLASTDTITGAKTFSTAPVINALPTGTAVASAATASTVMTRDSSGNANVNSIFEGFATTATAAGTTALTIASKQIQVFTGVTTQTVTLPTTSIAAGAQYQIINNSTGKVTVQSSGANTILIMDGLSSAIFTAVVATPTTAANWTTSYVSSVSRQNDTTNSIVTGARVETGWGVFAQAAISKKTESVTFGAAFATAPIVTVTYAGDQTGGTVAYGNGGDTVKGPVSIKVTAVSTTAFTLYAQPSDASSWGATDNVYYTWTAIGS
jgi:hypothetical protein